MIAAIIGWLWLIGFFFCFFVWTRELRKDFEFFSACVIAFIAAGFWPFVMFYELTKPSK